MFRNNPLFAENLIKQNIFVVNKINVLLLTEKSHRKNNAFTSKSQKYNN